MNSRTIATVAVFSALTVALNLSPFKIPAPYAPFLYYQIWEIPIVTAFLLFGPLVGLYVSIINTLVLLIYFPGALPVGPLYNLAAILGMLLGVYVAQKVVSRRSSIKNELVFILSSTVLGVISRVLIMSVVNWAFLRYPYPIGFELPEEVIVMMLPVIGFFNATLAMYTIPVGYVLARTISYSIKVKK
ncbi:hypothetical protein CP083_02285 [Candidatus Bathyarchaeota archaeon B24-2]|nr:MAG: hypothetical protein CP083_02285 [Candidatus Bathyarchaeota archaeon B24-2]